METSGAFGWDNGSGYYGHVRWIRLLGLQDTLWYNAREYLISSYVTVIDIWLAHKHYNRDQVGFLGTSTHVWIKVNSQIAIS